MYLMRCRVPGTPMRLSAEKSLLSCSGALHSSLALLALHSDAQSISSPAATATVSEIDLDKATSYSIPTSSIRINFAYTPRSAWCGQGKKLEANAAASLMFFAHTTAFILQVSFNVWIPSPVFIVA
jgi:hypothetical protein